MRHFIAFRGFAGIRDENGREIGTYWFESESEMTIVAPPPFEASSDVFPGVIFRHFVRSRGICQLWIWTIGENGRA